MPRWRLADTPHVSPHESHASQQDGPASDPARAVAYAFGEIPLPSVAARMTGLATRLEQEGALATIAIDAQPLAALAPAYGPYWHGRALHALAALVEDILGDLLEGGDVIAAASEPRDAIAVFLFRARGNDAFFRQQLALVTTHLGEEIAKRASEVVKPVRGEHHALPLLAVGHAVSLHHAGEREERTVRRAVLRACEDAALNAALASRDRARRSHRSTVGSFWTSVAVDGLSITKATFFPAASQVRVRE